MNELRRSAYLQAMGVDSYVSRTQLPGAAVTRRLAIIAVPFEGLAPAVEEATTRPIPMPAVEIEGRGRATRKAATDAPRSPEPAPRAEPTKHVPRFSLAAVVAGDWLWLEDLAGNPLASEQVWLIQAMARALDMFGAGAEPGVQSAGRIAADPDVAQFDWPIHNNQQLDLGVDAARAGVAGFVGRKIQQYGCRGVVLLGQGCEQWLAEDQIQLRMTVTASSADILTSPALKRQVWRDLLTLAIRQ